MGDNQGTHDSVLVFHGTDFNYPYGPVPDSWGTLTGTLKNGDPIDVLFSVWSNASMVLAVPEPSSLTLLAMGAVGLLAYAWHRRR